MFSLLITLSEGMERGPARVNAEELSKELLSPSLKILKFRLAALAGGARERPMPPRGAKSEGRRVLGAAPPGSARTAVKA